MSDVNSVSFTVNQLAEKIENLLQNQTRPSAESLQATNMTIDNIHRNIEHCRDRLEFAENRLDVLKGKLEGFQKYLYITNSAVFVGMAFASGWLYSRQYIRWSAALTTAAVGMVPLLFAHYRIVPNLHDMSLEIHKRKIRIDQLKLRLQELTRRLEEIQAQPMWYQHRAGLLRLSFIFIAPPCSDRSRMACVL